MCPSVELALVSRLAIHSAKSVTVACTVSSLASRVAKADLSSADSTVDIDWRCSSNKLVRAGMLIWPDESSLLVSFSLASLVPEAMKLITVVAHCY